MQLATIQELVQYWQTDYDWRKAEAKLNALPQFITNIDGLDIHFIQVRSNNPKALPLIINHGWPGSVLEQIKLIGPLTDPTGARAWAELMKRLGYTRYVAQGGDWGAFVVDRLGLQAPPGCHGSSRRRQGAPGR